eukprot:TRINITY_DN74952_c0_g1_i1.p1 TRINITY_DN74952_c0_g1~~TRINITY_DN74952_c0_g1_i1.p1  ORF type:complete len:101 (+),score=14.19 TRINITY_DN74952_c0_g1_i1:137-439(+)
MQISTSTEFSVLEDIRLCDLADAINESSSKSRRHQSMIAYFKSRRQENCEWCVLAVGVWNAERDDWQTQQRMCSFALQRLSGLAGLASLHWCCERECRYA